MPPVNNKREERRMNENKARGESEERRQTKERNFKQRNGKEE
jgi:hypothetical protein